MQISSLSWWSNRSKTFSFIILTAFYLKFYILRFRRNVYTSTKMFFSLSFSFKVNALANFKYFRIYFKIGYFLRISANKCEYLSVARTGTWLFYTSIDVVSYPLIINLFPCPLGPINLKNLIFCGLEIKILSFFLRILQTLTPCITTRLQNTEGAIFWNLLLNFQFLPKIDSSRGILITTLQASNPLLQLVEQNGQISLFWVLYFWRKTFLNIWLTCLQSTFCPKTLKKARWSQFCSKRT